MAAGDDEDIFGDFSFATFQSDSKSNSSPFADDEWGDFVKSPQQSLPADSLSFHENHQSNKPAPSSSWVKPRGALPLSLFGGADEEEDGNSGVSVGFNREKHSATAGDLSSSLAVKDVSSSQNFSMADLYNQFAQIDREKELGPSISGRVPSVENDAALRSNQEASGSRSAVSESKAMDLNYTVGVVGDSQLTEKSKNEDFDFKSLAPDSSKNEDLFGSWPEQFGGLVSYPNTTTPKSQALSSDMAMKSQQQQLNGTDAHGGGEWEFGNEKEISKRNTHSPGRVSAPARSHDMIKESNGSMDFFGTSTESVDYFASPSVSSTPSNELEFMSIWTGTATPNGLISNRNLNMEQVNSKDMLNSGPNVESGEFDEDFGEFTAASFDNKSESQEASTADIFSPSKGAAPTPNGKIQVDFMVPEVSKRNVNSSGSIRGLDNSLDVLGASNGSIDFFGTSTEPVDYFSTSKSISAISNEVDSTGVQFRTFDGLTPNAISASEQNMMKVLWNHDPFVGSAESDEDFGDFTTAVESGPKPGELSIFDINASSKYAVQSTNSKIQVDLTVDEASERTNSFVGTSDTKKSPDVFEMSNGAADLFGTSSELVDYFASSNGFSNTSQEVDVIGSKTSIATFDAFTPDIIEHNTVNGTLNHGLDIEDLEFDDDFGEFTTASAETVPHAAGESANNLFSLSDGIVSTSDGKLQEETKLNYQTGAIPLSIFGNEEPGNEETESGGSSNVQEMFQYQATSDQRNSHKPTTVVSIDDLISSLYSEAEQTSIINTVEKPNGNESSLAISVSNSSQVKDGDHVSDDGIWDSVDACTRDDIDSKNSPYSMENTTHFNVSSKLKPNDIFNFYYTLKEELYIVIKCHIEDQRQAEDDTAHSGEDAIAASLETEFQLICVELEHMKFQPEESNLIPSEGNFNKTVEVLKEPQFQILESEYQLSSKLMLVEKDIRSAMELLRHSKAMLKILTIGTLEERRAYISIWYEIISACAQELNYGASIWNQALEKQLQSHLLSEPQGRKYVLALGEIYRMVAVLGASAKLYKPWTFSGLPDLASIYSLLEECHAVWSTSGLEEALSDTSPIDTTSSLKSIRHILSLDALSLQHYVFSEKGTLCQLSILTAGVAPGMKMTMWGNVQCFVTLANVWANMISCDPPMLPDINLTDMKN